MWFYYISSYNVLKEMLITKKLNVFLNDLKLITRDGLNNKSNLVISLLRILEKIVWESNNLMVYWVRNLHYDMIRYDMSSITIYITFFKLMKTN